MNVKVTDLRQHLPRYLNRVRGGERIRVASHGQVIAEIAPATTLLEEALGARQRLRGSVLRYDRPLGPADSAESWSANR